MYIDVSNLSLATTEVAHTSTPTQHHPPTWRLSQPLSLGPAIILGGRRGIAGSPTPAPPHSTILPLGHFWRSSQPLTLGPAIILGGRRGIARSPHQHPHTAPCSHLVTFGGRHSPSALDRLLSWEEEEQLGHPYKHPHTAPSSEWLQGAVRNLNDSPPTSDSLESETLLTLSVLVRRSLSGGQQFTT